MAHGDFVGVFTCSRKDPIFTKIVNEGTLLYTKDLIVIGLPC